MANERPSPSPNPADIVGAEAVARLELAGFEIAFNPPKPGKMVARFTCPHCGHSDRGGLALDVFCEWGEAWHRKCVPWPPPSLRERRAGESDRRPMVKTHEPV